LWTVDHIFGQWCSYVMPICLFCEDYGTWKLQVYLVYWPIISLSKMLVWVSDPFIGYVILLFSFCL
jgi:hypothetical protein